MSDAVFACSASSFAVLRVPESEERAMRKQLLGVFALSCSMGVVVQARADITLVFDSGWIAGGEYTDITAGNTVSGVLTGLIFDLEFDTDTNGYTGAGDGGLCFMPSGATLGSYKLHCGGMNLGDFLVSGWISTQSPVAQGGRANNC
jgi:hypothetical protein